MRMRILAALAVVLALTACTHKNKASDNSNGGGGNQSGANSGKANGFEGSLTTSGGYAATWTAGPGVEADVFNSLESVTLISDHQTYGHISVKPDGSVSFGSGATELSAHGEFTGSGASVTLDKRGQFVCAFSVDSDLRDSRDDAILHLSGSMTVHWHPEGIGDLSCP